MSERTRKPLSRAKQSTIRVFITTCGSEVPINPFKFNASSSKEMDLRIFYPLFNNWKQLQLNENSSAFALKLLRIIFFM